MPQGYPDDPQKNFPINISNIQNQQQLYLAAVDQQEQQLVATGSRTAAVVGIADTIFEAEKIAESEIKKLQGNVFHRSDIGTKPLIEKRIQHMQELRTC